MHNGALTYYLYSLYLNGTRNAYISTFASAIHLGCPAPTSAMLGQVFWLRYDSTQNTWTYVGRRS